MNIFWDKVVCAPIVHHRNMRAVDHNYISAVQAVDVGESTFVFFVLEPAYVTQSAQPFACAPNYV